MKISDLISTLSKIQSLHGDLPVYLFGDAFDDENLMECDFISVKSGADPSQEYLLRPSENNPVWKKRVLVG